MFRRTILSILLGSFALVAGTPDVAAGNARDAVAKPLTAAEEKKLDAMALPVPAPRLGDFDAMQKSRLVRILIPYNQLFYFMDRGRQLGISYELGVAFEQFLNKKIKSKSLRIRVAFIPTARDQLLPGLIAGHGDIAVGGLTVTPAREAIVDFADPVARDVEEVVVAGPDAPAVVSLDDLGGHEVVVRRSSSYYEHLLAINERLKSEKKKPIQLLAADEDLEDGGIIEMAAAGMVDFTIVDKYKADFWKQVFDKIQVRDDLVVNEGGDIAWAIRKGSPLLKVEINEFMKTHRQGSAFLNQLIRKYVKNTKFVNNATSKAEMEKFERVVGFFQKYASEYDFDYLMLLAQGYQESQLDQSARSPRGAVGIMQLLPETAASPEVGITGIDKDAEKNVHAGTRYLRRLSDRYLNDPGIDQKNKTLMAFAAYNAGPGNLNKFRRLAEKSGLNKDIWFNNVEIASARVVGRETPEYVSNIYKYYVAYRLARERMQAAAK